MYAWTNIQVILLSGNTEWLKIILVYPDDVIIWLIFDRLGGY